MGASDETRSLFTRNVRGMIRKIGFDVEMSNSILIDLVKQIDKAVQCASEDQLVQILSYINHSDGSALPFSPGLFHGRPEVRIGCARIIQRLFICKIGPDLVNPMVKIAIRNILTPKQSDIIEYVDNCEAVDFSDDDRISRILSEQERSLESLNDFFSTPLRTSMAATLNDDVNYSIESFLPE